MTLAFNISVTVLNGESIKKLDYDEFKVLSISQSYMVDGPSSTQSPWADLGTEVLLCHGHCVCAVPPD
jgi:hypothetical protein